MCSIIKDFKVNEVIYYVILFLFLFFEGGGQKKDRCLSPTSRIPWAVGPVNVTRPLFFVSCSGCFSFPEIIWLHLPLRCKYSRAVCKAICGRVVAVAWEEREREKSFIETGE